jgi:hypothetical protein
MNNPWHQPHTNRKFIPANDKDKVTPWHYGWTVKQHVATIDPKTGIDCFGRYNFWRDCKHEWYFTTDGRRACNKCLHEEYPDPPDVIYIPGYANKTLLKDNEVDSDDE